MGHVTGADKVLKNFAGFQRKFMIGLFESVEAVAIVIETFIKVHYQRPISGVGFTDRTGALRKSITHTKVDVIGGVIVVWIFAGEEYGQHVEMISGGMYAFMLPGLLAKKPEIMGLLIKELKRRGLA